MTDQEEDLINREEEPIDQEEKLIAGYAELADFLNSKGFKTSRSTVTKYCSPAIATGPPTEGYFGRYPTFKPSRTLEWAKARLRPGRHAGTTA
jgi:hypothetical protein